MMTDEKIVLTPEGLKSDGKLGQLIASLPLPEDLKMTLVTTGNEWYRANLQRDPDAPPTSWADLGAVIGPITWDWPKWLPAGLLTMLVSQSGMGKSALALIIAKCYLTSAPWPDGTPFDSKLGKIIWCEAEAAQALNLQRAKDWGLPLDKILTPIDDPLLDFDLLDETHRAALAEKATYEDVRLIIIDSLSGAANDDDKPETKAAVKWIADLAKATGKPVLLLHHLRKRGLQDGDNITLDRVRGSSKVVQFARVIWALSQPDPIIEARRLDVIKSNLARFPEPIGLNIDSNGIDFGLAPEPPKREGQLDRAVDLLKYLLIDGAMAQKDIKDEFEGAGISWPTANRAKTKLGIISIKPPGQGKSAPWQWSFPSKIDGQ